MSKKKKPQSVNVPLSKPQIYELRQDTVATKISVFNTKVQYAFLLVIGFILYCNTFTNNWAFDDMMVILKNNYVQSGFAGIPKLFSGDSYEGFTQSMNEDQNELTGGRYRPLSLVTFAIEQQLLGLPTFESDTITATSPEAQKVKELKLKKQDAKLLSDMRVRHVVNVILYLLSVGVLFYFLRTVIFPGNQLAAFLTALIFTIHPIHTEVVANVKGRDEILSFLFICLTFIFAFKERDKGNGKLKYCLLACTCFFLALLSKEYAILLIVLLPLSFYVLKDYTPAKSIRSFLIYLIPVCVYLLLRYGAVKPAADITENDVMNNPYCLATGTEKIATEIAVLPNYLRLLFFPHPLAADYTFNQIPYTNFADFKVWLSAVIYSGLIVAAYFFIKKRHVAGLALALYLIFLALVSNFFVNIGTPMGERFIYHSSLGFAIVIGLLFSLGYEKIKLSPLAKPGLIMIVLVIVVLCGFKTIDRNKDWESNSTLFLKDVKNVPNSVIVNTNAGVACIGYSGKTQDTIQEKEWLRMALSYFNKCIALNGNFISAYINRGFCYYKLGEYEKALSDCDTVIKYYPVHPDLPFLSMSLSNYYSNLGYQYAIKNQYPEAIKYFSLGLQAKPDNYDLSYNLAFTLCQNKQYTEGRNILIRLLQAKPDHASARNLLTQLQPLFKTQ